MKLASSTGAMALAVSVFFGGVPVRAAGGAAVNAVEQSLQAMRAPGAQVVIVDRGKIAFDRAFGVRNVDTQQPVDVNTRFEIGSITKQFTAAAILQLRERGKLSLSDKLGKYVPEYPRAKNVTIQQLLWQVSGIPNYTDVPDFMRLATAFPGSFGAILALVRSKPLDFKPGTKWAYSNTNYVLLGRIVERVSGTPWEKYVRAHLFAPAGMTRSTFMEDERRTPDMATGYYIKKSSLTPSPSFHGWASSAGSIVSTAADVARWDAALFGGKIVSPADLGLMISPGRLANGTPTSYGFGWVVDTFDGQQRIWHNGGTFGFGGANHTFPGFSQRIIVLVNDSSASPDAIASNVLVALHPQLAAYGSKAVPGEDPAVTAKAEALWEQFMTGTLDRSTFTPEMNKQLTPEIVSGAQAQFEQLGAPLKWIYRGKKTARGYTTYAYRVTYAGGITLNVYMSLTKDGKIAGYLVSPN